MNWKTSVIIIAFFTIATFFGGFFVGKTSVSKEAQTVYKDRVVEVTVRDTVLLTPTQTITAPETIYVDVEPITGDSLIVSSAFHMDSVALVIVDAYAKCPVEYFDISTDYEPLIIEREKLVIVTDTVKTEVIREKASLKQKGSWGIVGVALGVIIGVIAT